jgi:hypothetical protein
MVPSCPTKICIIVNTTCSPTNNGSSVVYLDVVPCGGLLFKRGGLVWLKIRIRFRVVD